MGSMPDPFPLHLRLYGPGTSHAGMSRAEARSYCRHLALTQAEYLPAAWLLPRALVRHCQHLQAFHAWTRGLGQVAGGGGKALGQLRWWREELLALYDGRPRHPVMIALRETVERFQIPAQPFLDLLYACEQDQLVKRYRTFEQLLQHCQQAASPVGRLVLYLYECFDERRAGRADQLCTGLYLVHLWQHMRRDWEEDRVYLPEEDRRLFGYPDEELNARQATPAFLALMQCETERARDLLMRGLPLVDQVPKSLRPEVELLVAGGLATLDSIAAVGYNTWQHRPTVPPWDHARLLLRAFWQRWRPLRFAA